MGRRSALVLVGSLVFALGACGGDDGGGDEDAFCDSLEVLSDNVADGDLGSNDGLSDAVDTANELLEAAGSDQEEAVREVGEALAEADPDDAGDTAELVQDELGDLAEDCEIDEFAEAPEETTTTTEPEETTTTEVEDTTTTDDGGDPAGLNVLSPRDAVPADIEAPFAALAETCFLGNVAACDDIFFGTDDSGSDAAPQGSVARVYGGTCGGRIDEFVDGQPERCIENFFLATEPDVGTFTDPSFEGLAQACFANDMASCDTLFAQTGIDTPEELYGETCGFRLDPTVTELLPGQCTQIFGEVAFG